MSLKCGFWFIKTKSTNRTMYSNFYCLTQASSVGVKNMTSEIALLAWAFTGSLIGLIGHFLVQNGSYIAVEHYISLTYVVWRVVPSAVHSLMSVSQDKQLNLPKCDAVN